MSVYNIGKKKLPIHFGRMSKNLTFPPLNYEYHAFQLPLVSALYF